MTTHTWPFPRSISLSSSSSSSSSFLMLMFLWLSSVRTIHGFANNLIVSSIGCMTELDTTEVIMNNVVQSAAESEFPQMHLAVLKEDNKFLESPVPYRPSPGTTSADITIVFVNPYPIDDFPEKNDLQFVIQLKDTSGSKPGISAEFVGGGTIGCDGNQRVSARWKDYQGQVQLQIHDISVTFELWAGWATGQGVVRLTPVLVLQPASGDDEKVEETITKGVSDTAMDVEVVKNPKKNEGLEHEIESLPDDGNHDAESSPLQKDATDTRDDRLLGHRKEHKHREHKRKILKDKNPEEDRKSINTYTKKEDVDARRDPKANSDEDPGPLLTKREENVPPPLSKERQQIHSAAGATTAKMKERSTIPKKLVIDADQRKKELIGHMDRKFSPKKSFRRRYEDGLVVNSSSHFTACAFFILAMGVFFWAFSKRRDKGRRDL